MVVAHDYRTKILPQGTKVSVTSYVPDDEMYDRYLVGLRAENFLNPDTFTPEVCRQVKDFLQTQTRLSDKSALTAKSVEAGFHPDIMTSLTRRVTTQPSQLIGKKRQPSRGWTKASSRGNRDFLMSIDFEKCTGNAFAITLTIPSDSVPNTHTEFHRLIDNFLKRAKRFGVSRYHWLMECTAKLTPHLHMTMWSEMQLAEFTSYALHAWSEVTRAAGINISFKAQHIDQVKSPLGWAQYQGKHGARGAAHYQRDGFPESWEQTGRMWGRGGDWNSENLDREGITVDFENKSQLAQLRRNIRGYSVALAKKTKNEELRKKDIYYTKRMLRTSAQTIGEIRPLTSWLPQAVALQMVQAVTLKFAPDPTPTPRQVRIAELRSHYGLAA